MLRDSSERPRYIETIPRRGYRLIGELEVDESDVPELRVETFEGLLPPAEAAPIGDAETKSSRNGRASGTYAYSQQPITDATGVSPRPAEALGRAGTSLWRWLSGAAVLAVGLAAAIWYMRRPLPPPRISDSVQITHDGRPKDLAGTDGSRLYLFFWRSASHFAGWNSRRRDCPVSSTVAESLASRCLSGRVLLPRRLRGKRPTESVGFAGSGRDGASHGKWRDPSAAWSPDGKSMVYSTPANEIFMVRRDGTDLRKLVAAEDHNSGAWGFRLVAGRRHHSL